MARRTEQGEFWSRYLDRYLRAPLRAVGRWFERRILRPSFRLLRSPYSVGCRIYDGISAWLIRSKTLSLIALSLLLLIVVGFTWLVTLKSLYRYTFVPPKLTLDSDSSLWEFLAYNKENMFVVIFFAIAVILGFVMAAAIWFVRGRDSLRFDRGPAILRTLLFVLRDNVLEILLLAFIGILLLFNLAAWLSDLSNLADDVLTPTMVALFLTFISAMLTLTGMHYAFLAERKSSMSLDRATELLHEKAMFLEEFSGFIKRINRVISGRNGLLTALEDVDSGEHHYYHVKCLFLTPFLGHAALTLNEMDLFSDYERLNNNLSELMMSSYCQVQMLTLSPELLVNWYAQIILIEVLKQTKVMPDQNTFNRVRRLLVDEKIFGRTRVGKAKEADSFKFLYAKLYRDYLSQNDAVTSHPKAELGFYDRIPFQAFLVMERSIINSSKFPRAKAFRFEQGRPFEKGVCVVMSYVGSDTYRELIRGMAKSSKPYDKGIHGLLKKLHSGFYSEDDRMCRIIGAHFNHFWEAAQQAKQPPFIEQAYLENMDVKHAVGFSE